MFIGGTLDPANDSDWNTYLTTLNGMGEADLLQIAQQAYDRK